MSCLKKPVSLVQLVVLCTLGLVGCQGGMPFSNAGHSANSAPGEGVQTASQTVERASHTPVDRRQLGDLPLGMPLPTVPAPSWSTKLLQTYRQRSRDRGLRRLASKHAESIAAWNRWGAANLQEGDLVFMSCESERIISPFDFARLAQQITQSPFAHVGIIALEAGEPVIYDTDGPGPARTSFGLAMTEVNGIAIKRLAPSYQQYIPQSMAYVREAYEAQIPFDWKLRLDNDQLYCAELIELAFRSAGLPLSQPQRWDALPGIDQRPFYVGAIRWASGNRLQDTAIIPGNDEIGLWASPRLDLVLELTDAAAPPSPGESVQLVRLPASSSPEPDTALPTPIRLARPQRLPSTVR